MDNKFVLSFAFSSRQVSNALSSFLVGWMQFCFACLSGSQQLNSLFNNHLMSKHTVCRASPTTSPYALPTIDKLQVHIFDIPPHKAHPSNLSNLSTDNKYPAYPGRITLKYVILDYLSTAQLAIPRCRAHAISYEERHATKQK
ncbi:uncharacterized protein BT62DRAFT_93931 [Guyanagaster necrorhizus]|uniref:Uncharacterized protein n=1 Tax=Guyanagaster necrorhizus TaxID=856835 RepID=A0A9P7VSZ6_9AGAR|nr:uncharacterized protein BT62DRAFT_93931 [Guyanagaster necrorhizus MCA 3950]KAG7446926.1 hypothetical protein BT62DRAFT_93931 [Guyanagaster necrorhizus MCA 3950]